MVKKRKNDLTPPLLALEKGSRERNLDDGGSSEGVVVGSGSVGRGDEEVVLAVESLGDDDVSGRSVVGGDRLSKGGDEDGVTVDAGRVGELDLDGGARSGGTNHGGSGEGLDGESRVRGRARSDESRSKGVHLREAKGKVEGSRERILVLGGSADPGVVTSLDGQDLGSGLEVCRVGDRLGGTSVGRYSDTLKDLSNGNEGAWASVWKLVGAGRGGVDSSSLESGLKEGNVGCLVRSDLGDAVANPVGETSVGKVGCGVLSEPLLVERCLQIFKRESIVQNNSINVGSGNVGTLLDGRGNSQSSCAEGSKS